MRLDIGRKLLVSLPSDRRDPIPFVILDNLNEGADLLSDVGERQSLAEQNLVAGRRARERAAYDAALGYFRSGIRLLTPDSWQRHYDVTLALHLESFECAYFTGHFEEAQAAFQKVIEHAQTRVERGKAYYLKILLSSGLDRSDEAVTLGVEALQLFGERLPPAPKPLDLLVELARVVYRLRGRAPETLMHLPKMSDPDKKSVINLLMAICPAAYFRNPDLMCLAALRIVRMSLESGQTSASPFGYVLYGLVRGALFGDYKTGYEFGRLAVELADREGILAQRCKILMIFAGFVGFWRHPVEESVRLLRTSLQLALNCGDLQYANYSVLQILFLRLFKGDELDEIEQECIRYESFIEQTSDWFAISSSRVRHQFVLALKNRTAAPTSLSDGQFDEQKAVDAFQAAGNLTAWSYYLIVKTQLAFLFDDFEEARRYSDASQSQIKAVLNQIVVAEHYFYRALIGVALLRRGLGSWRIRRDVSRSRAKLRKWARNCPENFEAHHLLLTAEFASLGGARSVVDGCYDAAAAAAERRHVRHVEALTHELAGRFYLANRRTLVARSYLEAARRAYARWGAHAKSDHISRTYRAVLEEPQPETSAITPSASAGSGSVSNILDLDVLVPAGATPGNGPRASDLLNRLVRAIRESTQSEKALLITEHDGGFQLEAGGQAPQGAQLRTGADPLPFSERIVNYVLRTDTRLILRDPLADARFASCAYLRDNRPRFVACVPMSKGGGPLGVVYVENSNATGGLGPDHINSLMILAQQAALVVENERLGRSLRDNDASLHSALANLELLEHVRDHLAKFVPHSLQALIEQNPLDPDLGGKTEDLSIMFLDIGGYTRISEQLAPRDLKAMVETYFSGFADDVIRNGGEINEVAGDGLMIVFQDQHVQEHARRAVRTAIAIRDKTAALNSSRHAGWPSLVVNIGIHSGEALIGANKIESEMGTLWVYTVTGYAPNLAARVGACARDGAILVSGETAARVGAQFELRSMGPQEFKGISRAIEVFDVVAPLLEHDKAVTGSRDVSLGAGELL
jgi:class 3 adenylate cyclase/tetratricopeptide (TPR) repeat protein